MVVSVCLRVCLRTRIETTIQILMSDSSFDRKCLRDETFSIVDMQQAMAIIALAIELPGTALTSFGLLQLCIVPCTK